MASQGCRSARTSQRSGYWASTAPWTRSPIRIRTHTGRPSRLRADPSGRERAERLKTNTTFEAGMAERQAYVFIQLPETLQNVPAALLKVTRQRDGAYIGRFRYGDRYLERPDAVEFD